MESWRSVRKVVLSCLLNNKCSTAALSRAAALNDRQVRRCGEHTPRRMREPRYASAAVHILLTGQKSGALPCQARKHSRTRPAKHRGSSSVRALSSRASFSRIPFILFLFAPSNAKYRFGTRKRSAIFLSPLLHGQKQHASHWVGGYDAAAERVAIGIG